MLLQIFLFIICSSFLNVQCARYGCDFESRCSLISVDSFWGITDGEHPLNPTYPDHDHTFQNSSGHYLYFKYEKPPFPSNKDSLLTINQFFNTSDSNTTLRLTFSYTITSTIENQNFSLQLLLGDVNDLTNTWVTLNTFKNKTSNCQPAFLVCPACGKL